LEEKAIVLSGDELVEQVTRKVIKGDKLTSSDLLWTKYVLSNYVEGKLLDTDGGKSVETSFLEFQNKVLTEEL